MSFMSSAIIRPALINDAAAIAQIESCLFSEPWSQDAFVQELGHSFSRYFVASCNECICGYAGLWLVCDEAHIVNIAVLAEYQGRGIGAKLLERLINTADLNKQRIMMLEVRESNIAARALYEKYGFIDRGIRLGYYKIPIENAILMDLAL